jgi:hypothetical protein
MLPEESVYLVLRLKGHIHTGNKVIVVMPLLDRLAQQQQLRFDYRVFAPANVYRARDPDLAPAAAGGQFVRLGETRLQVNMNIYIVIRMIQKDQQQPKLAEIRVGQYHIGVSRHYSHPLTHHKRLDIQDNV